MQEIIRGIIEIEQNPIIRVITAVAIVLIFWILSSAISVAIIKLFKWKEKKVQNLKKSAFYKPIKTFIRILGIYIAVVILQDLLLINNEMMQFITKAFEVFMVIEFAIGLAESFADNGDFAKKYKKYSKKEVDDSVLKIGLKVARICIYVIAVFIIIGILGFNVTGIIAGLGLGGVIITLAAQDAAKSLFGGILIFIDKTLSVGDFIEVDKYSGTVEDISFRSTKLRTFDNSILNIPNVLLANSTVTNWGKMEQRRFKLRLCLELDTPLEKVDRFMNKIKKVLSEDDTIDNNGVIVKFEEIVDSGIQILIAAYTHSTDYKSFLKEKEEINYKILQIADMEKIELAYDTKTVHVKK